ncbi:hypothetical protein EG68_12056 [Paragonimus skrjabini miyazakii]|uniref:Uncharacterized protein n=1 Tax=Paragonimus skrjabini miyazakii TaxID=59628 RepID=A0A8S9YIF9_9TREM|nr:hypothetical protein EG68_12056 [Paragonimus skrjabini miyazakii]
MSIDNRLFFTFCVQQCLAKKIEDLEALERKRIQKLETVSGLSCIRSPLVKRRKPPNRQLHKTKQTQADVPWMQKQKPGYIPAPAVGHTTQCDVIGAAERTADNENTTNKHVLETESHTLQEEQIDPEACLHLPLWMIRNPTTAVREFLKTQQYSQLYQRGNALVLTSSDQLKK